MKKHIIFSLGLFLLFGGFFASASKPSDYGLKEGDLISAIFSDDPDVYIVNEHGYKRLFLNPEIFKFYTHLGGFASVKLVTPEIRDAFPTVGLFRNCEKNDPKVYGFESEDEDSGNLRWVNTSGDQAVKDDPDFFKKVFCINDKEFKWYKRGEELKSVKEVPQYYRAASTSSPQVAPAIPAIPAVPAIPASPSQPFSPSASVSQPLSPTASGSAPTIPASVSFSPTPAPVSIAQPAIPATSAQPASSASTPTPTPSTTASSSFTPTPTPTQTADSNSPSNFSAVLSDNAPSSEVDIQWTPPGDTTGVSGYFVYANSINISKGETLACSSGYPYSSGTLYHGAAGNLCSFISLSPATSYTITVAAVSTTGNISQSNSVNVTTKSNNWNICSSPDSDDNGSNYGINYAIKGQVTTPDYSLSDTCLGSSDYAPGNPPPNLKEIYCDATRTARAPYGYANLVYRYCPYGCNDGACNSTPTATILRNLTVGSSGDDVKQLQALLVNEVGYPTDLITGYFGSITQNAVKKLQEKYGIKPVLGYFGPITREALKALISN